MKIEERVARAGDGVRHLSTHAVVTAAVRLVLDAGPGSRPGRLRQADVDIFLGGHGRLGVIDAANDAAILDGVAGANAVDVVGEWPVRDAVTVVAIATEAGLGVEKNGVLKVASI